MAHRIEITIDVIVHATEDISKILQAFEILNLQKEDFQIDQVSGHYDNPIIMLKAEIVKKQALELKNTIFELLSVKQVDELIAEIDQRTVNSRFHMRLDKQELIKGNLTITDKGTIKLKIHTPIYNKQDTVKTFAEIFSKSN